MKNQILRNFLMVFLFSCLLHTPVIAGDITFDSFEAAEAAAKKRADEYQQRMQEHIKSINDDWEKQQKDLGSDSSSPDITKITTKADGQKSSDTDASKSMEDAVNSSVNKLKNDMISKAAPGSTGFAGGAAGYQWSVKFKNGKYVLSDSYNEAEFNTGKKKETETPAAQPEPAPENSGDDQDESPVVTDNDTDTPDTSPTPATTVSKNPDPAAEPTTGKSTDKPTNTEKPAQTTAVTPTAKPEEATKPGTGVDPAPVKLPPPSVRMVIQHPTDFSEEVFASNANSETTANYKLDKFKIPEDTRIKISVEVGHDVQPEDVSMVVTDDQGDTAPVTSAKLKNYRHMFRVPSDDKYSASVFVTDKKSPGNQQKKILQVMIPVSKVDFESRTIDNQRGAKSGSGDSKSSMSTAATSSSAGSSDIDHSSFGRAQQVDLSDLYSDSSSSSSGTGTGDSSSSTASSGDDSSSQSGNNSADPGQSTSAGQQSGAGDSSATGPGADGSYDSSASNAGATESGDSANTGSINSNAQSDSGNYGTEGSSEGQADTAGTGDGSSSSDSSASGDSTLDGSSSSSAGSSTDDNGNSEGASEAADSAASGANLDAANAPGNETHSNLGVDGSSPAKGNDSAAKAGKNDRTGLPVTEEDDPFILGLSLKAEAQKVYQSFDFIDGTSQTSAAIKAGGEVAFSLSLSPQVEPESVLIKLSDGSQEIKGNLKRMGESFVYVFPAPTESAFIEVSGKTVKSSFNYRVGIPVK